MLKYTILILLSCFSLVSCNEEDKENTIEEILEGNDEAYKAEKERERVKREKDLQEILDTPPRRLGF